MWSEPKGDLSNTNKIVDHFVEQAKWCDALGSPFTAALLTRFAADYRAGGPVRDICFDWTTNPRKDALGLRLTGALHHAVLSATAPALAALYPGRAVEAYILWSAAPRLRWGRTGAS